MIKGIIMNFLRTKQDNFSVISCLFIFPRPNVDMWRMYSRLHHIYSPLPSPSHPLSRSLPAVGSGPARGRASSLM